MKRSHVAPADFEPDESQVQWAMETFDIPAKEVARQTGAFKRHEYKRAYSHWNLAWKRWFYKAEEIETLKRPRKPVLVEPLTEEQRQADILKFKRDPLVQGALRRK